MKANRLALFDFTTRPMRAFHVTWVSFFLCFFAWFGMAPLMPIVRNELHLSKEQRSKTGSASLPSSRSRCSTSSTPTPANGRRW